MALPLWLSGIFSGGLNIVGSWLKSWQERKTMKAEHKVRMEQIKLEGKEYREKAKLEHEINWDMYMAQGSMNSWKDEFYVIILSIPMVGVFIPGVAHYILEGFQVLAQCPDWYKGAIGVAIGASFGYRKYSDWTLKRLMKKNGDLSEPEGAVRGPDGKLIEEFNEDE